MEKLGKLGTGKLGNLGTGGTFTNFHSLRKIGSVPSVADFSGVANPMASTVSIPTLAKSARAEHPQLGKSEKKIAAERLGLWCPAFERQPILRHGG